MKKEAEKRNTKLIASYHNFKKTPKKKELESILKKLLLYETDYVKIACFCRNEEDMLRLLSISKLNPKVVPVGMGNYGPLFRVLSPFFNIPFTYASSKRNKNIAPGQIFYKELEDKWLEIL
ncbi:MAG: type I 3-dehydroquinate dehydratase [bacterium]